MRGDEAKERERKRERKWGGMSFGVVCLGLRGGRGGGGD